LVCGFVVGDAVLRSCRCMLTWCCKRFGWQPLAGHYLHPTFVWRFGSAGLRCSATYGLWFWFATPYLPHGSTAFYHTATRCTAATHHACRPLPPLPFPAPRLPHTTPTGLLCGHLALALSRSFKCVARTDSFGSPVVWFVGWMDEGVCSCFARLLVSVQRLPMPLLFSGRLAAGIRSLWRAGAFFSLHPFSVRWRMGRPHRALLRLPCTTAPHLRKHPLLLRTLPPPLCGRYTTR